MILERIVEVGEKRLGAAVSNSRLNGSAVKILKKYKNGHSQVAIKKGGGT